MALFLRRERRHLACVFRAQSRHLIKKNALGVFEASPQLDQQYSSGIVEGLNSKAKR
jgi:hypothetical protein